MNANLTQNFGLKYFLVVRAVTRVTYAIIDTFGLLGPDLQVALASANAPLRILNNLNKGSIHLIVCDDSKILIVSRLSTHHHSLFLSAPTILIQLKLTFQLHLLQQRHYYACPVALLLK